MALIAVGLAAPASANAAVPKHPTVQGFLAAARAAGIIGTGQAQRRGVRGRSIA
jgi:hypothetical protein